MLRFAQAIGLVMLTSAPALSQSGLADCKTDQTQSGLNICSYQRFQADDAVLNRTYAALRTKLDADGRRYLKDALAAWIKFRDAECLSLSGGPRESGGTIWPLLNNQCMSRLTKARTLDLEEQVKCPGSGLSC